MKKLLTFLLFCFFSTFCFSQETEKLPEMPWANIAEMNQVPNLEETLWKGNVFVKLQGFYTLEDSLIVAEAIQELDSLTETISIQFSTGPRGNLEVFIMDSLWYPTGDYFISETSHPSSLNPNKNMSSYNSFDKGRIYTRIYMIRGKTRNYENWLKNKIATSLVSGGLSFDENQWIAKNRISIFNSRQESINGITQWGKELNELDKAIIRETYRSGYNERLEIAKQQFKPKKSALGWLEKANPYVYLIFPCALLLFVLFPFYMKLTRYISVRITNKLLAFNLKSTVGILILTTIGFLYFSVAYRIYFRDLVIAPLKVVFAIYGLSLLIGLITFNLIRFVEIYIHKNTELLGLKIVLIFLSTGLIPYFGLLTMYRFVLNGKFTKGDIEIFSYVFLAMIIIAGFRTIISYFFFKEKDLIFESETKLSKLRELKTKAELNALHSRINPHFLYNSLNSIAGLAHTNADQTEHMALSLSKLFRYSINKEKSDWTTFREELEMVKIYLDVEKVRFADRLVYSIEITDELKEMKIPRFIIQPLAENAVKHGISKSIEEGEIKIKVQKEKKDILITVADSGKEFPRDLIPGFGLQSIYDKLEILYGDKFELSFTNSPEKQVSLKLK